MTIRCIDRCAIGLVPPLHAQTSAVRTIQPPRKPLEDVGNGLKQCPTKACETEGTRSDPRRALLVRADEHHAPQVRKSAGRANKRTVRTASPGHEWLEWGRIRARTGLAVLIRLFRTISFCTRLHHGDQVEGDHSQCLVRATCAHVCGCWSARCARARMAGRPRIFAVTTESTTLANARTRRTVTARARMAARGRTASPTEPARTPSKTSRAPSA